MKKLKQGLVEQLKRKKCRPRNHMTSEVEWLGKRKYNKINHKTLEEGIKKRKNHKEFRNRNEWRLFQQQKKRKQNLRLN
jgi:hypothetical protein